ncbi:hypothetical protein AX14_001935 [Amanita brunnescens Koide BX004]|nr:hypothetical protein AX14_001935 [Amanita brunnescens Koide BX004]
MEHELQDLNVIRGSEDEEDMHNSTTLLEPSEGDAPATDLNNNRGVSEAYSASMLSRRSFSRHYQAEDDFRSLGKRSNRSKLELFIRPIIAFSWQFIVLVMLTAFIIRTETTAYPTIPRHLASLYQQYPQGAVTAITLVGSLLSLLSTKAFSEAIRFATVVSLASPGSRNMSLYSLYARITVGSGDTLFDFGNGRRAWTFISLVSLLLFAVQTAAWTTILTPRVTDIPYQTSFQDFNYADADAIYHGGSELGSMDWATAWQSGYAAAMNSKTNMTLYPSFFGYIFNGTCRGILPITPTFDNWTKVEAIQQGLTAEVNCEATPASDPDFRIHQTAMENGMVEIYLCCGCPGGTDIEVYSSELVVFDEARYVAFTTCSISDADNDITAYVIVYDAFPTGKHTCTIRPRWLNVNTTYIRDGFVTVEPTYQLPDIPLHSSSIIQSATSILEDHFTNSQTPWQNNILENMIINSNFTPNSPEEFITKKLVSHILHHRDHSSLSLTT